MCNPREDFNCKYWEDNNTVDGYCKKKRRDCKELECNYVICNISRTCENCTGCIGGTGSRLW